MDDALVVGGAEGLGERFTSARRGFFVARDGAVPTGRVFNVAGVQC